MPEITEESKKKLDTDWVLIKISGLGRVSGTRWALLTGAATAADIKVYKLATALVIW